MFQWGRGGCFSDGGAYFLSGGVPHAGALVLVRGGGFENPLPNNPE